MKRAVQVPTEGHYFDRVDVDGENHSRTYVANGQEVLYLQAVPDPERPGRWQVAVRWRRLAKGPKLHQHGWGPLESEKDALALMDAVGIGYEAACGGATCLGNLPEQEAPAAPTEAPGEADPKTVKRTKAVVACKAAGWRAGTVLKSVCWAYEKVIRKVDELNGEVVLYCQGNNSQQRAKTLPTDAWAVSS
jgi:hypothetical protein